MVKKLRKGPNKTKDAKYDLNYIKIKLFCISRWSFNNFLNSSDIFALKIVIDPSNFLIELYFYNLKPRVARQKTARLKIKK